MIFFSIPIKEHPFKADSGDKINFLPCFHFYNQLQLYQWWHYWINGGYWISDHNQIKWKTNNTIKWGKVDITDHFWHHISFLTSQIISDITDHFWHHRSFLTSQIISDITDHFWHHRSFLQTFSWFKVTNIFSWEDFFHILTNHKLLCTLLAILHVRL
jgi:hypothetical protein